MLQHKHVEVYALLQKNAAHDFTVYTAAKAKPQGLFFGVVGYLAGRCVQFLLPRERRAGAGSKCHPKRFCWIIANTPAVAQSTWRRLTAIILRHHKIVYAIATG